MAVEEALLAPYSVGWVKIHPLASLGCQQYGQQQEMADFISYNCL